MSLVFTLPGKIGDALHQFPVAYHYCAMNETRCTLWLDEGTLKPLVPLFEAQPCVEKVELKGGITSYHMGGQPYDFGLKIADHLDHEIYHLGFRNFPSRQITLETFSQVPLKIDPPSTEACLVPTPSTNPANRLLLHGTFLSHASGVPGFWRFLSLHRADLEREFSEIVFTGTPTERARALELYPDYAAFDDQGSYLKLAEHMARSRLVIGAGSSNVALAGALGVPCVRVHDPIGEAPKVIWNNLGPRQWNETEVELRRSWPQILSEMKEPVAV